MKNQKIITPDGFAVIASGPPRTTERASSKPKVISGEFTFLPDPNVRHYKEGPTPPVPAPFANMVPSLAGFTMYPPDDAPAPRPAPEKAQADPYRQPTIKEDIYTLAEFTRIAKSLIEAGHCPGDVREAFKLKSWIIVRRLFHE